jgi:hypothetical protein
LISRVPHDESSSSCCASTKYLYNPIFHSQLTFLDAPSTGLGNVHRSLSTRYPFLFEKQK